MNETGVTLTREQILAFREWMFSKADDPGRGSMVYAVCDLALAQSADSLLAFQSAILRETTAHRHRMDEQLYPLREVARVADLVWRGAVRCQTDEENYFRISPMDMEWLATALTKVKAPAPAYDPKPDWRCKACEETGARHCSDPANCGGMKAPAPACKTCGGYQEVKKMVGPTFEQWQPCPDCAKAS